MGFVLGLRFALAASLERTSPSQGLRERESAERLWGTFVTCPELDGHVTNVPHSRRCNIAHDDLGSAQE
jgi:hypothetical protein